MRSYREQPSTPLLARGAPMDTDDAEKELLDLLTYECPYTKKRRVAGRGEALETPCPESNYVQPSPHCIIIWHYSSLLHSISPMSAGPAQMRSVVTASLGAPTAVPAPACSITDDQENMYLDYFDRGHQFPSSSPLEVMPKTDIAVPQSRSSNPALLSEMGNLFNADDFDWKLAEPNGLFLKALNARSCKKITAGKILLHARTRLTALREQIGIRLCIFKVGVTSNPPQRFSCYVEKGFTAMWVLCVSQSIDEVHMLEAALISEYHKHVGCRNRADSGGEGALNRGQPPLPPYFVYVVAGRADQGRWLG